MSLTATSRSIGRPEPSALRRLRDVQEVGVLVPLVVFALIFYTFNDRFLSVISITTMLRALAFVGIIAVGQTLLMLAGEFDLSVGSVAALAAVVSAWLMHFGNWSVLPALVAGLLVGAMTGLVNGFFAVKLGLPALIVTLGMLYIARGLVFVVSHGVPIYPLPEAVGTFGQMDVLGTSWAFVTFVVLVLVADFAMRQTIYGSMIFATGGNTRAARVAGIDTDKVKMVCFVLVGMLSAVAGVMAMGFIGDGDPQIGLGWELDVIAAVVIGGVSLFGGVGSVAGTALGVLIMQVVRNGLVFTGVDINWTNVAVGSILIAAVAADLLRREPRSRRGGKKSFLGSLLRRQ